MPECNSFWQIQYDTLFNYISKSIYSVCQSIYVQIAPGCYFFNRHIKCDFFAQVSGLSCFGLDLTISPHLLIMFAQYMKSINYMKQEIKKPLAKWFDRSKAITKSANYVQPVSCLQLLMQHTWSTVSPVKQNMPIWSEICCQLCFEPSDFKLLTSWVRIEIIRSAIPFTSCNLQWEIHHCTF